MKIILKLLLYITIIFLNSGINIDSNQLISSLTNIKESTYKVNVDGKYGLIKLSGEYLVEPIFKDLSEYDDYYIGYTVDENKKKKHYFISQKGDVILLAERFYILKHTLSTDENCIYFCDAYYRSSPSESSSEYQYYNTQAGPYDEIIYRLNLSDYSIDTLPMSTKILVLETPKYRVYQTFDEKYWMENLNGEKISDTYNHFYYNEKNNDVLVFCKDREEFRNIDTKVFLVDSTGKEYFSTKIISDENYSIAKYDNYLLYEVDLIDVVINEKTVNLEIFRIHIEKETPPNFFSRSDQVNSQYEKRSGTKNFAYRREYVETKIIKLDSYEIIDADNTLEDIIFFRFFEDDITKNEPETHIYDFNMNLIESFSGKAILANRYQNKLGKDIYVFWLTEDARFINRNICGARIYDKDFNFIGEISCLDKNTVITDSEGMIETYYDLGFREKFGSGYNYIGYPIRDKIFKENVMLDKEFLIYEKMLLRNYMLKRQQEQEERIRVISSNNYNTFERGIYDVKNDKLISFGICDEFEFYNVNKIYVRSDKFNGYMDIDKNIIFKFEELESSKDEEVTIELDKIFNYIYK